MASSRKEKSAVYVKRSALSIRASNANWPYKAIRGGTNWNDSIISDIDELERFHKMKVKSSWSISCSGIPCICMFCWLILGLIMLTPALLYPSLTKTTCNITDVFISMGCVCHSICIDNNMVSQYTFEPSDGSSFGPNNECQTLSQREDCVEESRFEAGQNVDCYLWDDKCKGDVLKDYESDFIIFIVSAVLFAIMCGLFLWRIIVSYKLWKQYGCYWYCSKYSAANAEILIKKKREHAANTGL